MTLASPRPNFTNGYLWGLQEKQAPSLGPNLFVLFVLFVSLHTPLYITGPIWYILYHHFFDSLCWIGKPLLYVLILILAVLILYLVYLLLPIIIVLVASGLSIAPFYLVYLFFAKGLSYFWRLVFPAEPEPQTDLALTEVDDYNRQLEYMLWKHKYAELSNSQHTLPQNSGAYTSEPKPRTNISIHNTYSQNTTYVAPAVIPNHYETKPTYTPSAYRAIGTLVPIDSWPRKKSLPAATVSQESLASPKAIQNPFSKGSKPYQSQDVTPPSFAAAFSKYSLADPRLEVARSKLLGTSCFPLIRPDGRIIYYHLVTCNSLCTSRPPGILCPGEVAGLWIKARPRCSDTEFLTTNGVPHLQIIYMAKNPWSKLVSS
ncbi:hypothetical protein DSO57_1003320 [Entomophthora muscae]|uniref:Uncharacterized protein n=1 Tax=Entomophthora muscae TaxID=34485 RepID=A0ACC2T8J9_9FUNG|nr:hypothetical protein DSO57_1003320 [Entomophthora muscae]